MDFWECGFVRMWCIMVMGLLVMVGVLWCDCDLVWDVFFLCVVLVVDFMFLVVYLVVRWLVWLFMCFFYWNGLVEGELLVMFFCFDWLDWRVCWWRILLFGWFWLFFCFLWWVERWCIFDWLRCIGLCYGFWCGWCWVEGFVWLDMGWIWFCSFRWCFWFWFGCFCWGGVGIWWVCFVLVWFWWLFWYWLFWDWCC